MNFYKGKRQFLYLKMEKSNAQLYKMRNNCGLEVVHRKDWEDTADCNLLQTQTGINLGCIDNIGGGRGGRV